MFAPGLDEYREWADAEAALTIFGQNGPYADGYHTGIYLYGLLYPLLGGALHFLFHGDILVELRLLSYALTWLTALFAAHMLLQRTGKTWIAALGCALCLVADWHGVTGSAISAPLGSLLLLAAISAANRRRPVTAALLTVLGFFVKPYFVAIYLPLQIYFFLHRRRDALCYFAACLLAGIAIALAVKIVYPYYFVYNVVHHLNAAIRDPFHLLKQANIVVLLFAPLFVLGIVRLARQRRIALTDATGLSAIFLWIVWLRLGMHAGAFMSYTYHLCLPPLVVFALAFLPDLKRRWRVLYAVWIFVAGLIVGSCWHNLPVYKAAYKTNQQQIMQDFFPEGDDYSRAACLTPSLARFAVQRGVPVVDNGMWGYVPSLNSTRRAVLFLFPEVRDLRYRAQTFEPSLHEAIAEHRWDVVYTDAFYCIVREEEMLRAGYTKHEGEIQLDPRHRIKVFRWTL
ncbi:MAG: hypothetical protein IJ729_02215 [Alloprevotella sp.]|nr:hypothetical protein [Alloprevotella sp.]